VSALGPAVIVDPYSSGAQFAPAFHEAGVPVVAVVSAPTPPDVYAASYRPQDFDEVVTFSGDLDAVVARLSALRPCCIVTGCESGVELADAIVPRVLPEQANVPSLAGARRHKGEMAAAVALAGLPIIPQICTDDHREVAAWIRAEGLAGHDLVVKPPKSASTDGVTRIRGGQGWQAVFADLLGRRNRLGLINDRLLVQEYAEGTEYVVDTFSHDGVHTVTDVCRYRKVDNGPHMAIYDSMEWVEPADPRVATLADYARRVLDAVGLRFGAAHVELMLTADGPRLIELGARPHGGGHPRFCRVATGDSQVDRAVRHFTGQGTVPADYALRCHMLVVFLISRASGVVRDIGALADVSALSSHHVSAINLRPGQRVDVTRDLFGSLELGFVVLAHERREQILLDYEAIRAMERGLALDPTARSRHVAAA
jgi:biotin carboxylase